MKKEFVFGTGLAYVQIDEEMKKFDIDRKEYKTKWKYLPFLATINANDSTTKGFDTMKKALTSIEVVEDDNGISAAKTPKKMLRQEFEKKKMLVLNKAVGIVNEHKKASEPLSEEEHFGMIVAKTLARLSGKNKLLTKKKINDILFEAEFQQDQASGQNLHHQTALHWTPEEEANKVLDAFVKDLRKSGKIGGVIHKKTISKQQVQKLFESSGTMSRRHKKSSTAAKNSMVLPWNLLRKTSQKTSEK
ncbi:hypothetical protein OS493_030395 [Desmophyllum pertusum]|uniref:Uncharacterized protein n=1 Tax=Desmophyllum pertusum TaxID=174260 RepID=A0A9W9Z988_9CNID|nr:hypothetical protein OS493_030395 [Desmophyllum pertusum]